jgi:hypothetical protein
MPVISISHQGGRASASERLLAAMEIIRGLLPVERPLVTMISHQA